MQWVSAGKQDARHAPPAKDVLHKFTTFAVPAGPTRLPVTDITDARAGPTRQSQVMAFAGTKRTPAALLLTLTLVLCSQWGVADGLCASPVTHCRMQPSAMHAADAHSCCPNHSKLSDSAQAPQWTMRAPCCNLSSAPDRPVAVYSLANDSRLEPPQAASVAQVQDACPLAGIGWFAATGDSPPVRAVLDVKADLRI